VPGGDSPGPAPASDFEPVAHVSPDSTVMASPIDELGSPGSDDRFPVPMLGRRTAEGHQRVLSILLAVALVALAGAVYWTVSQTDKVALQVAATGQSLMQSQRLAKSVSQALVGSAEAFPEVKDSSLTCWPSTVRRPGQGDDQLRLQPVARAAGRRDKITPLMERAEKNAGHRDGPAEDPDPGG
jgi:hypothetical protein